MSFLLLLLSSSSLPPAEEGITKTFACARALVGQYVFLQLVGVEGSLSLCEVEVFATDGEYAADPSRKRERRARACATGATSDRASRFI